MQRTLVALAVFSLFFSTVSALPQSVATAFNSAPDMFYEAVPNFFAAPAGDYMGEKQGVATNSKGHVFAFFRGPHTRLWEFGSDGQFIKEIGKDYFGFLFAHSVRIDRYDNIWTVDEGTNVITKFNPSGTKVLMVIGHRPGQYEGPYATPHGPNSPAGKYTLCRPTDVAWDTQDNIFVSDGYCNNRVIKYDKNGHFLAQSGCAFRKPHPGILRKFIESPCGCPEMTPVEKPDARRECRRVACRRPDGLPAR